MALLICGHDGAENLPQALVCVQCGSRLSRVQRGSVFVERYRVLELLGKTETGFRYRAELEGQPCILLEIIPKSVRPKDSVILFDRVARRVKELHPRCLASVLEYFSHRSCFYIVETIPDGKILRQRIDDDGPWAEERARSLLDGLLLGLQELHSATPPLYVGALGTEKILVDGDSPPVFMEPRCFSDGVIESAPSSANGYFAQDLNGCAQAVVAALAGDPKPEPQRVGHVIGTIKDLEFSCTLDWVLRPKGKEPASLGQLAQFRGLIADGRAAEKSGNFDRATELLEHALHISSLRRLETSLHELEKLRRSSPTPITEPPQEKRTDQAKEKSEAAPNTGGINPPAKDTTNGDLSAQGQSIQQAVQAQVQTVQAPKRSRSGVFMLLALLLGIAVAGWVWISGAQMRKFDSALAKGQLLSPSGASAYDIYKEALVSDGADNSTVQEMNSKASPMLHALSDQQFARWYQNSDLNAAQWEELARAEDWLNSLDSSDVTSQARKAYADAELAFKQRQYADALNGFEHALQRLPNWDLAIMGIGKACFELKRYECSEQYYLRAEQLEPGWIWPHRNLMELYRSSERRNIPAACSEYRQMMDLSSSMNPPPFNRQSVQKKMDPVCRSLTTSPEVFQTPQP